MSICTKACSEKARHPHLQLQAVLPSSPMGSSTGLTCEDMGKGIATGDLQGGMLGPKDI